MNYGLLALKSARVGLILLLAGLFHAPFSVAAPAQTQNPSVANPSIALPLNTQTNLEADKKEFRNFMSRLALPSEGCFEAHYPNRSWQKVQCKPSPSFPNPLRRPVQPFNVGDGTDYFALANGSTITSATGSFDSVTGVTDVFGSKGNNLTTVFDNTYALQLNANTFSTPLCNGAPGCFGWEQFIFSQRSECDSPCVYIEYWLYNSNAPCPNGWISFPGSPPAAAGCFFNTQPTPVPVQPIADLGKLILTGTVKSGGPDTVLLSTANGGVYANNQNSIVGLAEVNLGLAGAWSGAEFNIFGDCCESETYLNSGSNVTVRLAIDNGTTNAPTCTNYFRWVTVETNNLNLLTASCSAVSNPSPAIVYTESGGGPLPGGLSVGDTHLTMFSGVHYDLQASGEFVLVQADPGFIVQTRQKPFNPPSVSVNTGVGIQLGSNRVAVCLNGVIVNGWPTTISDGRSLSLPEGASISRTGNTYLISSPIGHTVRAEIAGANINVTVKLGATNPENVRGLLGTKDSDGLTTRDGRVLRQPISRADFASYADSWRVNPSDSLVCSVGKVPPGMPTSPIYASDLPASEYERVQNICQQAGVADKILLDDCMLDVSMLGSATAADVFVHARIPTKDIRAVP